MANNISSLINNSFNEYINSLGDNMLFFNPFEAIFQFIKSNIMPKHPQLLKCKMFDDEENEFSKEYYFKYDNNLSFDEVNKLHHDILEDIYHYCRELGYLEDFNNISIFLSR